MSAVLIISATIFILSMYYFYVDASMQSCMKTLQNNMFDCEVNKMNGIRFCYPEYKYDLTRGLLYYCSDSYIARVSRYSLLIFISFIVFVVVGLVKIFS